MPSRKGKIPFNSLDTFPSSFNGNPVLSPMDDCEHPLLYLSDLLSKDRYINLCNSEYEPVKGNELLCWFKGCCMREILVLVRKLQENNVRAQFVQNVEMFLENVFMLLPC
jgi:hypothetical protein